MMPGGQYPPQGAPMAPPPAPKTSTARTVVLVILGVLVLFCLVLGSIAVPAFTRYMRRAKTMEAVANLDTICRSVDGYVAQNNQLPESAPRTPAQVPTGVRAVDPPGAWSAPGWQAIGFSVPTPHFYSYEFVSDGTTFTARAIGDLDGDGTYSTFERAGQLAVPPGQPHCGPHPYMNNEME